MARQPELEQAAKPALIGVHLEKGENGLLIQGRVRLKSKPEISEIGGHGQAGGGGARFDLRALALGDDYLEVPVPVAALLPFRDGTVSFSFPARVSALVEPKASKKAGGRTAEGGDVGQHHTSCRQKLWHSLTIFVHLCPSSANSVHSTAISVKPAIFCRSLP